MVPTRSLAELDLWHAGHVEPVIEPSRAIVDPHHHLWRREPYVYEVSELLADLDTGHDVRATVFVQNNARYRTEGPEALRPVGETDYVRALAEAEASGRACAGIVGFADLTLGAAVRDVLAAHVAAGGGRFRGIRQQVQHHPEIGSMARLSPPEGLLGDPAFREGFAQLAPLGLSFDAWLYFTQLGELADLAATFPETTIVLDHLGAPLGIGPYEGRRDEVFASWSIGIKTLARHSNVSVKLGGLGMPLMGFGFERQEAPPTSAELAEAWRPYVLTCIHAFGANRCMFESNFPVDKQSCSYRTLWNAFKRIAGDASEAEKDALFQGTARRVYDLGSEACEN